MIGTSVEFVIGSGTFLEGEVVEQTKDKIIVKDHEGRFWEGHPSQVFSHSPYIESSNSTNTRKGSSDGKPS